MTNVAVHTKKMSTVTSLVMRHYLEYVGLEFLPPLSVHDACRRCLDVHTSYSVTQHASALGRMDRTAST